MVTGSTARCCPKEDLEQIRSCDGLIGFATRRQEPGVPAGSNETHLWVVQELAVALGQGIRLLEVREDGLGGQKGILADRHRITYNPDKPMACLVDLAGALGEWHRTPKSEFLLIRDNLYRDLVAFIDREDDFKCQYPRPSEGFDFELDRQQSDSEEQSFVSRRAKAAHWRERADPPDGEGQSGPCLSLGCRANRCRQHCRRGTDAGRARSDRGRGVA